MPLIGFLSSVSASVTSKRISSFGQGLSDTGYTVGRDVTVEARMAEGQDDRLPELAADLVNGRVRLIAASGPPAAFAAKQAAMSIPIVFVAAFDPVQTGLVATLNQPGGNVTGVTLIGARLGGQRLELARELVPNVGVIAVITNPNSTDASEELRDVQNAARATGQELVVVAATSHRDFEAAFAVIVQRRAQVLLFSTDPFLAQSADRIIALAAQHRIPAVYAASESVAGGSVDVIARVITPRFSEVLGQQVIVENVGAAAGIVGVNRVAHALPDGYSMLLGTVGTHAYNPALYKKLSYNPAADFAPVGLI